MECKMWENRQCQLAIKDCIEIDHLWEFHIWNWIGQCKEIVSLLHNILHLGFPNKSGSNNLCSMGQCCLKLIIIFLSLHCNYHNLLGMPLGIFLFFWSITALKSERKTSDRQISVFKRHNRQTDALASIWLGPFFIAIFFMHFFGVKTGRRRAPKRPKSRIWTQEK